MVYIEKTSFSTALFCNIVKTMKNLLKDRLKNIPAKRWIYLFFLAVLVFAVFIVFLNYGLEKYNQWKGEQRISKLAEIFKKIKENDYKLALADTYGGKTPQETLDMFISAVEKSDYELASRYFVISQQEKWRNELMKIKESNKIITFLDPIKEARNSEGEYSQNDNSFSIYKPIGIIFLKYPNGIWKIIEI